MIKKLYNICRKEWLSGLGVLFCFISVALVAVIKIEGIILMVISEGVWSWIGYKKGIYFLVLQNFVLFIIDGYGIYYWITSGKGTWLILDFINILN